MQDLSDPLIVSYIRCVHCFVVPSYLTVFPVAFVLFRSVTACDSLCVQVRPNIYSCTHSHVTSIPTHTHVTHTRTMHIVNLNVCTCVCM